MVVLVVIILKKLVGLHILVMGEVVVGLEVRHHLRVQLVELMVKIGLDKLRLVVMEHQQ
jgi:hypothetical protein